jgi:transposase
VLKVLQRSATKNRTQSLNQLRNLIATAPDELRDKLRALKTAELIKDLRGVPRQS